MSMLLVWSPADLLAKWEETSLVPFKISTAFETNSRLLKRRRVLPLCCFLWLSLANSSALAALVNLKPAIRPVSSTMVSLIWRAPSLVSKADLSDSRLLFSTLRKPVVTTNWERPSLIWLRGILLWYSY